MSMLLRISFRQIGTALICKIMLDNCRVKRDNDTHILAVAACTILFRYQERQQAIYKKQTIEKVQ